MPDISPVPDRVTGLISTLEEAARQGRLDLFKEKFLSATVTDGKFRSDLALYLLRNCGGCAAYSNLTLQQEEKRHGAEYTKPLLVEVGLQCGQEADWIRGAGKDRCTFADLVENCFRADRRQIAI